MYRENCLKQFENKRHEINFELSKICYASDNDFGLPIYDKNRRHAIGVVKDAIEYGLLDNNNFKVVVDRYNLEGFVECRTTSLPEQQMRLRGHIVKLDREIRKSEDNHKTPPTEKIGDIFVSVCYAIDIGMGDMEYIKELAGRYNISKSNVA